MKTLKGFRYFCWILFISSIQASPISIIAPRDEDPYRLPEGLLTVQSYDLELTLLENLFDTNVFDGVLDLTFALLQDTHEIKLHANGISFSEVILRDEDNNPIALENEDFTIDNTTEFFTITASETLLSGGVYTIHFEYEAQLRVGGLNGLYKSTYTTSTGEVRPLATTQFQTTSARKVFPSFDEPSFKATFDISIVHPTEYNAVGNTPGVTVDIDNSNLKRTTFRRTPVMPTYLIALVISDFTCTRGENIEDDIPYAICSHPGTEDIRQFAIDIGPELIWSLEELTGIKYSVSEIGKIDQFAIPDFSAGAMENWGLVTYRETGLLWDPAESTNSNLQSIALVIAHEFTHFWFGNLVTTHWWSDTWLNEGFARYYQYIAAVKVLEEWELDKQFVTGALHGALINDAVPNSAALSAPASSPSEVSARFGTLSYSKGASVIGMVHHLMGNDNYNAGIHEYLANHQFGNTKPEDLWAALAPYTTNLPSGVDLPTVMDKWINLNGFPVLKVKPSGDGIVISQQRFLSSGTTTPEHKWYVPVSYTTSNDESKFESTTARAWVLPDEDLTIPGVLSEEESWIILNNHQTGFYRIDYDRTLRNKILQALKKDNFDGIPELNRGQLIDDLYNLARYGQHSFVEFIDFVSFLENDDSYFAWYEAFTAFNYILPRVGETRIRRVLYEYLAVLIEKFYNSAPIEARDDDNQILTLKRVLGASWACRLGVENCKSGARAAFAEYKATSIKPDKNLRASIYCNGLRHSNDIENDWQFLYNQYLSTSSDANMLSALGCAEDTNIINQFIEKSIDAESGFSPEQITTVFSAVYTNNFEGVDISLDFLIENYEAIYARTNSYTAINTIISNLASRFGRNDQIAKLGSFLETANLPDDSINSATTALNNARLTVAEIVAFEKDLILLFEDDIVDNSDPYRLPEGLLKVNSYDLELTLLENVFDTNVFTGVLDLEFELLESTNEIKLHANGTEFIDVTLHGDDGVEILLDNEEFSINSETDFFTIVTRSHLVSGKVYTIHFEYIAQLRTGLSGLYRSTYTTSTGEERVLATTQFQPTDARKAFPCFDEPSFKATFDIRIVHSTGLNAIANTPGESAQLPENPALTRTTFRRTPRMPTYLIAFVISDFTCSQGENIEDGIPYAICSQPETVDEREFAVDIGPKIILALEELTGVKYSVSGIGKIDQFAIPDFSAGAMENWGLVTYREVYLLWDPIESTNTYKQYIATIISHEFGHFWFGNLVTTHWWSDTWLNEGFATYYENFGVAKVLPDWELDKQFVVGAVHAALTSDASINSAALTSPASTPSQVSGRFSTVSYSKGGSVIRMVSDFMGEDNFKSGITDYLTINQFGNTKPENLWAALEPYASDLPQPLPEVMYNWVNLPGYPLVKVAVNNTSVTISQHRFLSSGTPNPEHKWYVPLSYTTSSDATKFENSRPRAWLLPNEDLVINNVLTGTEPWIVLNHHQSGFYRIDYDKSIWDNILKALKRPNFENIPELNRGQLIDDLFNLVRYGEHSLVELVEFVSFLEQDDSYFAWYEAFTAFNYILPRVGDSRIRTVLNEYLAKLIEVFYNSAPIHQRDDDNQMLTLKRNLAASWSCRLGVENCKGHVRSAFADYKNTKTKPDKNLRSTLYCNGIRHSTDIEGDFQFLFDEFLGEASESTMLTGLGCAADEQTIINLLEKSLDPTSGLLASHVATVFSGIYSNNIEGIDISFDFLIENFERIAERTGSYNAINTILTNLGSRFSRSDQLEKLEALIENPEVPDSVKNNARTTLENARVTVAFVEEFEKDLTVFFDNDRGSSSGILRAEFVITMTVCFLALFFNK